MRSPTPEPTVIMIWVETYEFDTRFFLLQPDGESDAVRDDSMRTGTAESLKISLRAQVVEFMKEEFIAQPARSRNTISENEGL